MIATEIDRALDALAALDPGCSRDDWVRAAMAAKAAGLSFDAFHAWSEAGANYANERDCRSVWNSIRDGGGIGAGTLYAMARDAGWREQINGRHRPQERPREPRSDPPKANTRAEDVCAVWDAARPATPEHPYVRRKLMLPFGLRVRQSDGALLVPVYEADGGLQSLQAIPAEPGAKKLNFAGAPMTGGRFVVGGPIEGGDVYLAEGIAAAMTAHQATGRPAVCAFGAGNVARIAADLHERHPDARLVVVADRGKEAASERIAGDVAGAFVALPESLPANADINDVHVDQGLEAAAALLAQAVTPKPATAGLPVQDGDEFLRAFTPPHFVLEPILARGHLVACTAHPNAGKSSVAIQLSLATAGLVTLAGMDATPGRVLYLVGENDDNLRSQALAACLQHGIDHDRLHGRIDFIPRRLPLADSLVALASLARARGGYSLIVVDTRISYSDALDENDNTQAHKDATALRDLTRIDGSPAVLVLCHPTKGAPRDNLLPRGGSSFYGEIDENLTLWADGEDVTMEATKRRIPDFPPIAWRTELVTLRGVVDHKKRPIVSVVARRVTDAQQEVAARDRRQDENRLLHAMLHHPSESLAAWASLCGWVDGAGKAQRWKAQRIAERLAEHKLAKKYRERWVLTAAGKDEARGSE